MDAQYCQRCGATLPDQDEGICPGCGTPFGARTVAISVGAGDLLAAHEAKQRAAMAQSPPVAGAPGPSGAEKSAVGLMVGVAVVVVLLVVVIVFLLLRSA